MIPMILRYALDGENEVELVLNRIFQTESGKSYAVLYPTNEDIDSIDMESSGDDRVILRAIPKSVEGEQSDQDYELEVITDQQELQCATDAYIAILHEEVLAEINGD